MADWIVPTAQAVAGNPLLLAGLLFAATFVAEDVATIVAGAIVGQLGASAAAALPAVILGTATGEIALFLLGRWGTQTAIAKRLRTRPDVARAEHWVRHNSLGLVLAARFLPGTRLPVFTASGFVGANTTAVLAIIAVTTPVWTTALFETARRAGSASADQLVVSILPLGVLLMGASVHFRRRARII